MIRTLEEDYADSLAEQIRGHWLSLGFEVDIKFIPVSGRSLKKDARLDIRSNMINGYPAGFLKRDRR